MKKSISKLKVFLLLLSLTSVSKAEITELLTDKISCKASINGADFHVFTKVLSEEPVESHVYSAKLSKVIEALVVIVPGESGKIIGEIRMKLDDEIIGVVATVTRSYKSSDSVGQSQFLELSMPGVASVICNR